MTHAEIAQELKIALLYKDGNDGAVKRIAERLGLSLRTIYDYLDGKIKPNLRFIKTAVEVTGDPDIKRLLEPEGWELVPAGAFAKHDKSTIAEECLDDLPHLAAFHAVLNDPASDYRTVIAARDALLTEIHQNVDLWKVQHGVA